MALQTKFFRYILFFLLMIAIRSPLFSQLESDSTKKFYFGGSAGAQFGQETALELSPLVGYKVTQNFSVGFGLSYIYYSFSDANFPNMKYETSIYGGRLFAKDYVFRNIFGYAEFEILNLEEPNPFTGDLQRRTTTNPLLGGGFSQSMGGNAFMHFIILWDINPDVFSPYTNPIFRIGLTF